MSYQRVVVLNVFVWGKHVGAVAPAERGYAFEYLPAWRRGGVELAPILMPLASRRRIFAFPNLNEQTYQGLPPMLADAVPDRFGNGVIDSALAREGILPRQISALDRLAYVGARGMGALTFAPDSSPKTTHLAVEMSHLVEAARAAVHGDLNDPDVATRSLNELIQVGTSAGGARAKAVIAWNTTTGQMRVGGVSAPEGFEQWLLKFDGVGTDNQLGQALSYGRTEYAYHLMATAAGIQMSQCRLLEEGGRAHFVTRRFDRPGTSGDSLHLQSLCALSALDFNAIETHDYASLFTTAESLGVDDHDQLFRRMAFNVLASNNDDHTKNHAFLMSSDGTWSLAPGYDITFAYNVRSPWTAKHLMSVNGKFSDITKADLHAVGERFAVPGYRAIIRDVQASVKGWDEFAAMAGLPDERTAEVATRLDTVAL